MGLVDTSSFSYRIIKEQQQFAATIQEIRLQETKLDKLSNQISILSNDSVAKRPLEDEELQTQPCNICGTYFDVLISPNQKENWRDEVDAATSRAESFSDMRGRIKEGDLVLDATVDQALSTLFLGACGAIVESYVDEDRNEILGLSLASSDMDSRVSVNVGAAHDLDGLERNQPVRLLRISLGSDPIVVLRGAKALIGKDRPQIYVEIQNVQEFGTVSAWLEEQDYCLWDTFAGVPTHLFVPNQDASSERRFARLQTRAGRDAYSDIEERARTRQALAEARRELAQQISSAKALQEENDILKVGHADRLNDIAALMREIGVIHGETEALRSEHAALLDENKAMSLKLKNLNFPQRRGGISAWSRFVLFVMQPLLWLHLSDWERMLYRHDPSQLFRNARHPVMISIGKLARLI